LLHTHNAKENLKSPPVRSADKKQGNNVVTYQFVDNRAEAITPHKFQKMSNNNQLSNRVSQLKAYAESPNINSPTAIQKKENQTGLPDQLKSGIEQLSGYSMNDVKVHYNSSKPAQLRAHAFAQGTEIHLGMGQEKHLPHEAWHVVQQKQGRVKPTLQMKGKVDINDDPGLEKEADEMGSKAERIQESNLQNTYVEKPFSSALTQLRHLSMGVSGLTHLVVLDEERDSIFEGKEGQEVEEGDQVTIETEDEVYSRRGPNQELFREHDEFGAQSYIWNKTEELFKGGSRIGLRGRQYIRKDALKPLSRTSELPWHMIRTRPESGPEPERVHPDDQRTRGSHKLIRFDIWHKNAEAPGTPPVSDFGHLTVFDYATGGAYEIRGKYTRDGIIDMPAFPSAERDETLEGARPYPYRIIDKTHSIPPGSVEPRTKTLPGMWQSQAVRNDTEADGTKTPKFNRVDALTLMLTEAEYRYIMSMFRQRLQDNMYSVYKEAQSRMIAGPIEGHKLVSRCLSFLEDLAAQRSYSTTVGAAYSILQSFITEHISKRSTALLGETMDLRRDAPTGQLSEETPYSIRPGSTVAYGKGIPSSGVPRRPRVDMSEYRF